MQLTGNPFVDTGLMVLTTLACKERADDLHLADIRQVFGAGSELARINQRLKSYTMVFGTNGPLTQPAYRKNGKNEAVYLGTLNRLLAYLDTEGASGPPCDLTGVRTDLDFHQVSSAALAEAGLPIPEKKWIGRDWVPLGGSLGNDAQALPGASRPLHVSALALLALQYLPLGVFLFKRKLTCYQSTAGQLTQELVADVVEKNQAKISAGHAETLGKGEGTRIVLDFLLTRFERLQEHQTDTSLPRNTGLLLWLFSNSGPGADCMIEEVPESALRFASQAAFLGYTHELRRLMNADPKDWRIQLFECIRNGRDYRGLYPLKKWPGASPEFYDFYQQQVRGINSAALAVAAKVAGAVVGESTEKECVQIRKPEYLRSPSGRNRLRKAFIDHLSIGEYDAIFPSVHHPIRIQPTSWELIRFYLAQQKLARKLEFGSLTMKTTHPKIVQIGDVYFEQQGSKKIKNTLDRLAQRKLGVRWLQDVFCRFAEERKDFSLGAWDEFACDEDGKPIVFELLFQMRLYLANKYRESLAAQKEVTA